MNKHDHELIDECLAGRTESFGALVVRYQDRLFNSLTCVLGSAEDARDTSQDAFVQAFQKLGGFRRDAAFYSWLFRIALNIAASRRRKEKRRPVSVDAVRESSGFEPTDDDPAIRPSHGMESGENQAAVMTALGELQEEYRTVIVLKEIEGLKYEEIAEIVGCPVGTVRSRIHRARAELRQKLKSFWES